MAWKSQQSDNKKILSRTQGQLAEDWCRKFLTNQGLTFIDKNYHSRYGEIDLVFLDKNAEPQTLIFVEVRYRKQENYGSGSETVTFSKQKKIIKTAQFFLQKEQNFSQFNARFDVVSVTSTKGDFTADWQINAFQANAW